MIFRKLRVAWSVVWGIACVLFVMWWVRSYWRLDVITRITASGSTTVRADSGLVTLTQMGSVRFFTDSATWAHVVDNASLGIQFWQFDWARNASIFLVRMPIWVPALVAAILARVPWIRWSKRFSLRALLIAMAIIALALTMIMAFE